MASHKQPTKDELEPDLEELDKLAEEPVVDEPGEEEPEAEETPEVEEEEVDEVIEEVDYKKKFVESSKESIVLHAKNRKTQEAIARAAELGEPTEEELMKEYSDWEDLSPTQQRIAKENLINSRRFNLLSEANEDYKNLDEWSKKIDEFSDDPKSLTDNPKLEGKMEEFKTFAAKPSRRGVDFSDLVSAFLYEEETHRPIKSKGKMFDDGTAGPKEQPKKDKLTIEEGAQLKKADYSKYKEMLIAGKIESEF